MTHPTIQQPTYLTAVAVPTLDVLATCRVTTTGIHISIREGELTDYTAPTIVDLVDDAVLIAICAAWGIHLPPSAVRADVIAAIGPLAHMIVTAALIPPCLDPARVRA